MDDLSIYSVRTNGLTLCPIVWRPYAPWYVDKPLREARGFVYVYKSRADTQIFIRGGQANMGHLWLVSLGATIERYNNEAWHEDCFEIIFKIPFHSVDKRYSVRDRKEIFPYPQLCGKRLGLISIAKAQVHLDCCIRGWYHWHKQGAYINKPPYENSSSRKETYPRFQISHDNADRHMSLCLEM